MKTIAKSILEKLNLAVVSNKVFDNIPIEASEEEKKIMQKCKPFSMTGNWRMWAIVQAVKHVQYNNIDGDFIECGVWKGANLVLMQNLIDLYGLEKRKIYGYDTFEGMSDSTEIDVDHQNRKWMNFSKSSKNNLSAGIDLVNKLYSENTETNNNLKLVKGDVLITLTDEEKLPKKISILRLDTDWYESTKFELEVLYPRLVKGGVLIIDDYGHWKGARKAVDEYFQDTYKLMHVIDYTCRMMFKE